MDLILRPPTAEDFEAWRRGHLGCAPAKSPFEPPARTEEALEADDYQELMQRLDRKREEDHSHVFFGFVEREWVGTFSLFDCLRGSQSTVWMGYHVLNPYWGRGLATRGARRALSIAFGELEFHRVESLVDVDNLASQRVAEKVGMRREGLSRGRVMHAMQWRDVIVYAMTAGELAASE